jgi:heat shock protein HslJ
VATPGAGGGLTGGIWQWVRTEMGDGTTTTVPNPANYTIEFLADGTAGVRADCNVGNATYVVTGTNAIDITLGVSTLVACPPGSLDTEYRRQLEEVNSYVLQGDTLSLALPLDSGIMTFTRVAVVQPTAPAATALPIETPQVQPTLAPPVATPEVPGMPRTGAKD